MAISLSNINNTLLPPTITGPIFEQAEEASAVMRLARRVPLAMTAQTAIPVSMDVPAAGWVTEGGAKPVGAGGISVKTMTGKKVALLLPVSQEIAMTNAAGLYAQLKQDLPTAIARAFDHAAIHGVDLRTGGAGPFSQYLKQGANSIELGTATQANGGIYTDLVNGEKAVVDANFDFTGIAADPRLRPLLKLSVDTTGRPIWVDNPQAGVNSGSIIGVPASFNRGVSGFYQRHGHRVQTVTLTGVPTGGTFVLTGNGAATAAIAYNATAATVQTAVRTLGGDFSNATVSGSAGGPWAVTLNQGAAGPAPLTLTTNSLTGGTTPSVTIAAVAPTGTTLRGIGGDWSQCAYGVGMDISIKVSTEASYVDEAGNTVSAFQNNLVLLLVEAYYGFVKSDAAAAWTAYIDAA